MNNNIEFTTLIAFEMKAFLNLCNRTVCFVEPPCCSTLGISSLKKAIHFYNVWLIYIACTWHLLISMYLVQTTTYFLLKCFLHFIHTLQLNIILIFQKIKKFMRFFFASSHLVISWFFTTILKLIIFLILQNFMKILVFFSVFLQVPCSELTNISVLY